MKNDDNFLQDNRTIHSVTIGFDVISVFILDLQNLLIDCTIEKKEMEIMNFDEIDYIVNNKILDDERIYKAFEPLIISSIKNYLR